MFLTKPTAIGVSFAGLLCIGIAPCPISADVVVFKTGRAMEGIVVKETETSVRFETENGVVAFPRTAIESIARSDKAENRELRQRWAIEREREERQRALRRAERRREREEAEANAADKEANTESEDRAVAAHQEASDRRRIAQHQERWRAAQEPDEPSTDTEPSDTETEAAANTTAASAPTAIGVQPIKIEELRLSADPAAGTRVTASLVNFGAVAHRRVQMDIELVENARAANEYILQKRSYPIAVIAAESITRIDIVFPVVSPNPVEARIVNLTSVPDQ